jgi:hypothetical protein
LGRGEGEGSPFVFLEGVYFDEEGIVCFVFDGFYYEDGHHSVTVAAVSQVNSPTSSFFSKCGMALKVNTAVDVEKKRSDIAMALMELVEKDQEIAKVLGDVME